MSIKERVIHLVEGLSEADLRMVERMLRGLSLPDEQAPAAASAEEHRARVRAAYGFLKGGNRTVEDFLREKHEDTEREEERYRQRHPEES